MWWELLLVGVPPVGGGVLASVEGAGAGALGFGGVPALVDGGGGELAVGVALGEVCLTLRALRD